MSIVSYLIPLPPYMMQTMEDRVYQVLAGLEPYVDSDFLVVSTWTNIDVAEK